MATLASEEQLAARLGYTPAGDEQGRATSCLEAASDLIREVADDPLADPPSRVVSICIDVALRAFTNPEAWSQRSLGDENRAWARGGVEGGAIVYLTDEEERSVLKAVSKSTFVSLDLETPWTESTTSSII